MRRLKTEAGTGRSRRRILRIPVQGWVAALLVMVLLGGGYTQYSGELRQGAGAQYKVLPYKPLPATTSGGMIEKTEEPLVYLLPEVPLSKDSKGYKENKLNEMKRSKAYNILEKLLPPGEYASYVMSRTDQKDASFGVSTYRPLLTFKDYAAYKTSVEKYNAPIVMQPGYMPEGYALDQANINPSFLKHSDEKQLEGGSEKDLGDNFRMTWRVEKAENIGYFTSSLVYKKGKVQVKINASRVDDKSKPAYSLPWNKNTKVENIEIDGKQLIYVDNSSNKEIDMGSMYNLYWSDPEAQIVYSVGVRQKDSELTKDEIIRIAASMMN
ncbi:hypothetical protein B9T62_03820 [Paenibacillus donghaensis]|uniref:Uncharacterized protein n=2 Tax=Paenibacillus donghaensis TaxID=414771 RepID=A0A2Z2K9C0_9BACL|nr:hypothetical protein B9T62_03820 [Paenibacillus donghaensis]